MVISFFNAITLMQTAQTAERQNAISNAFSVFCRSIPNIIMTFFHFVFFISILSRSLIHSLVRLSHSTSKRTAQTHTRQNGSGGNGNG